MVVLRGSGKIMLDSRLCSISGVCQHGLRQAGQRVALRAISATSSRDSPCIVRQIAMFETMRARLRRYSNPRFCGSKRYRFNSMQRFSCRKRRHPTPDFPCSFAGYSRATRHWQRAAVQMHGGLPLWPSLRARISSAKWRAEIGDLRVEQPVCANAISACARACSGQDARVILFAESGIAQLDPCMDSGALHSSLDVVDWAHKIVSGG